MLSSNPDMATAETEIQLGGRKWRAKPLTDVDLAELEEWAREHIFAAARRAAEGQPEGVAIAVLDKARREAQEVTWASPATLNLVNSLAGACKMLWMALRKCHPDLTEEQVRELLATPQTRTAAALALKRLMERATGKATPRPKGRRTRNRKRPRK